jgi:predicted nucleic acid-binding protein
MKVFLDANILVSVLNKEYPVFTYSSRILSLAGHKGVTLYTSPLCIAIAFYFSEKKDGRSRAKQKITVLSDHLAITAMDGLTLKDALKNKRVNDVEDGLEYYSAIGSGCKCIITEDKSDFYFSEIEVLNCRDYFQKYIKH